MPGRPGNPHQPVLLRETLDLLRPATGGVFVDATVGPGGHSEALLAAVGPGGRVLGIDRDPAALDFARRRLRGFAERFVPVRGDYRDLRELLEQHGVFSVDGVVADLGVSSLQLDDAQRGFAFRLDGPLDMRMDPDSGISAEQWLSAVNEAELRRALRDFGEERHAALVARAIVRARESAPIRTTARLRDIVSEALGPRARRFRIHPATRTFQAIRIAVNRELDGLDRLVDQSVSLLQRGGRLVVISFHSLEDRAVKRALRSLAQRCICPPSLPVCGCGRENLIRILTARVVRPSTREIEQNARARSARLRAAERL